MRTKPLLTLYALLLLTALFSGSDVAYGQALATDYLFYTGRDGYLTQDINGNAIDMVNGSTTLAISGDDASTGLFNIPIPFSLFGVVTNQISVTTNGIVGHDVDVGGARTYYQAGSRIMTPFGVDMYVRGGAAVKWKVVGSSPYRCLVIQWENMSIRYTSTNITDGTFQCRMYETLNAIEYVYANMANNGTETFNGTEGVIGFSKGTNANEMVYVQAPSTVVYPSGAPVYNTYPNTGTIADLNSTSEGARKRYVFSFQQYPFSNQNNPTIPPLAGFAYNMQVDTVWLQSPYIFTNTSNNALKSYWDVTGYSTTVNGTYSSYPVPRTPPTVKCAPQWPNTCYLDTTNRNFTWTFNQRGYYKLKLKVTNNYGSDSIEKVVYVDTPSTRPVASFFSDKRLVGFGDVANYYDLSLNGPTQWQWTLNPPYYGINTFANSGLPNIFNPGPTVQNPGVTALDGGTFDVCLKVWNARGSDSLCRRGYLTVNNSYTMCNGTDTVSKLMSGYIYDGGGPVGDYYAASTGQCPAGFRIAACADSLEIFIERFKLKPGDSVTFRTGSFSGPIVKRIGGSNLADNLRYYKIPTGTLFVQMSTTSNSNDSGFAIRWNGIPASYGKPKAGFDAPSIIYSGYTINYNNTSTGVNMGFRWDSNGDGYFGIDNPADVDSLSANPSRTYTTTTPQIKHICVIATNCKGSDTSCKDITVLPLTSKPTADFTVDRTTGFTTDIFKFTDLSTNGALQWQWSFVPSNVTFVNGTSASSQNPQVIFNSATNYTVSLKAINSLGNDTKTAIAMISVVAYNSPGSQSLIPNGSDIGISRVTLANVDTTTGLQIPTYDPLYTKKIATLYRGVDYTVTTYRITATDPMTTKVWIDYNMNASFTDAGETLISQTRQNKVSTSQVFRIPNTSPTGNTRMRVGISYDLTTLTPDYAQIGCFEDYGIIIGVDTIKPVLTLKGNGIYKMEVGSTYNEPGVIATDNLEGDISSRYVVNGTIDVNTVGYYTLTYTVKDLYGNTSAPVTRIVQVEINQKGPTITLTGADTVKVAVFGTYVEQHATAKDNTGRDITNLITISGDVNTQVLGTYPVTYSVTDAFGFVASKTRIVMVIDTVKPVIRSLDGKDTIRYQIGTPYEDQVMVTDNYWQGLTAWRTGTINVNVKGDYTLVYDATDSSGNAANTYRLVVKIDDTVAPEIMLSGTGKEEITVDVKTQYVDPGVDYSDNFYDVGNLTLTQTPAQGPDMNRIGDYTITYTVCDPSQNCSSVQRIVHVVDRIAPVITLQGANPYTHTRFTPYVDPGVILSDNYWTEDDLKKNPFFQADYSKVSNDKPGIYIVTFNLTDPSGNKARTVTRLVVVPEESTTGIVDVSNSSSFKVYPNPSTGRFTIDLLEGTAVKTVKVYNMVGALVKELPVKASEQQISIDLINEPAGMYILRLEGEAKSYMQKVQVAK